MQTKKMMGWILGALWLGLASAGWARVDVNRAGQSELESIRGIGPAMSARILAERDKRGPFKSPADLSRRVSGIGEKTLNKLQSNGLTVPAQKIPEPSRPPKMER
ncbi:MAG: helix-hairpin-helix domain-containing protein [Proteobacteria bacterium]|jgi:competence protein ComEA|nr:helix-hairpin-helix domain-containing protein [Pseudomonadota bacterium]MDA0847789.1 helix-hairpin-helix domain-containing protein [Pseudomonadota bacterium]